MNTKTKRRLFCLISYFFALFVLPISIAVGAFDDMKTSKKADADTEYTLVGNILNNGDDWNTTPHDGGWKLTNTGSEYVIKNVYMIAQDYSDFRIITWGSWTNDYGWPKVVTNEPGFTASGSDNNIHITKTGYYDIRLYDNKSKIEIKYSELTLVGNIENRNDWNVTPQSGKWKFQKNGSYGFKLENVYMVAHSDSNFRILPWGDTTWQTKLGWQQLNYSGVSTNEPSFTSVGSDNNIHITKTGYYNIYLKYSTAKKDWYIQLYYDQGQTTELECQVWVNNEKVISAETQGFDFNFTYDDSITTKYSSLSAEKLISNAHQYKKFFVTGWTSSSGYYLHDYRIGYTDNTTSYTEAGSSSTRFARTHAESGTKNYIILYFLTANYTIAYNRNGGGGTTPSNQTVQVGSTVTFRNYTGTKAGYTFTGWNTNSSGTGTHYAANGTGTPTTARGKTLTLYAEWSAKASALTFNLNDGTGTVPTGLSASYGSAMPTYSESVPTKTNYRFAGFYDGTGDAATQYYTATLASARTWNKDTTAGTTLYAKWLPLTSLTFYLDASTIDFGNETPWFGYNESGDVPEGASGNWSAMSRISHSYEGVTLNFWTITINNVYTGDNLKLRINNTSVAHWDTGSFAYNSSYNTFWSNSSTTPNMYLGDGSIHAITKYEKMGSNDPIQQGDPSYLLDGTMYQIPNHTDHLGYDFNKWCSSSTGSGTTYTEGDFIAFTEDSSIYALYNSSTYNMVFWKGSGSVASWAYVWYTDGSGDHNYKAWPGEGANDIEIGGTWYKYYSFPSEYTKIIINDGNGWQTSDLLVADGDGKYYDLDTSSWKDLSIPLVTKDKGGSDYSGSDTRDTSFPYSETYQIPDGTKTGYTAEWHLKSDCSDTPISDLSAYMYLSEVTLYADWVPNVYTINLNTLDATTSGTTTIYEKYGVGYYSDSSATSAITSITIPTKVNSTGLEAVFGGYFTEQGGNGTQVIAANGDILASSTSFLSTTTLYAKWTVTFTFDPNEYQGGAGTPFTREAVLNGGSFYIPTKGELYKLGYKLNPDNAWNANPDGSSQDIYLWMPGSISGTEVTELYEEGANVFYANWLSKEGDAAYLARMFNTEIAGICDEAGLDTDFTKLKKSWDEWTRDLNENDAYWMTEARSSDTDILAMLAKYDYVLGKYGYGEGEDQLHDFLNRKPAVNSAARNFTPFDLLNSGDDNNITTVIVIITSAVALLSITALSALIVRKRKKSVD